MAANIRITITPEIEKALSILRFTTSGTLNTTELIKYAIGKAAAMQLDTPSRAQMQQLLAKELNKSVDLKDFDNFAEHETSS